MHDDAGQVRARVARVMRERLVPAVHRDRRPLAVTAWVAPGEPVPFADARAQEFRPFAVGSPWGRPWGRSWFHVTGTVPEEWDEPELLVDLGFTGASPGFQAEGLVYAADGTVLSGIAPLRRHVPLRGPLCRSFARKLAHGAGCADRSVRRGGGEPEHRRRRGSSRRPRWATSRPPGDDAAVPPRRGRASRCSTGRCGSCSPDVWALDGLVAAAARRPAAPGRGAARAGPGGRRRWIPTTSSGTAAAARAELAEVLGRARATPARTGSAPSGTRTSTPPGCGRCARPSARSRARSPTSLALLDRARRARVRRVVGPAVRLDARSTSPSCSPGSRRTCAAGRFVPVGGMWVESDTNMPGGEALARQFVHGKRLLPRASSGWRPRRCGCPTRSATPRRCRRSSRPAGAALVPHPEDLAGTTPTVIPHHTFGWEGIDGTRIFTHFPPVDTYNAELSGARAGPRASGNFAREGRGPTRRWCRSAGATAAAGRPGRCWPRRAADRATWRARRRSGSSPPAEFFAAAEAEYPDPPVWVGRAVPGVPPRHLHHARRAPSAATGAASTCCARPSCGRPPPPCGPARPTRTRRWSRCWETVLLQQFHDILPGTSIAWVHRRGRAGRTRAVAERAGAADRRTRCALLVGDRRRASCVANAGPLRGRRGRRRWASRPPADRRAGDRRRRRATASCWTTACCGSSSTSAG